MDIKNKKPFFLTKDFWSLKGTEKKIAEAKHNLAGEQLERRLLELQVFDDKDRQLKIIDIDRRYGKLSELEFNKQSATIKEEPYVGVVNTHFNPKDPKIGFFELDWNTAFVDNLKSHGYQGQTEEEIVDRWFQTLCNTIGNEQGIDVTGSGYVQINRREDGKTEVS